MQHDKTDDDAIASRMHDLLEKKAAREKDRAKAKRAHALESLELEMRFEDELGPRGSAFEIVDCTEHDSGFIVVKLGESVHHTKFMHAVETKKAPTEADVAAYVDPCIVHPTKEEYRKIVAARPALANRCANALATLFGVKGEGEEGKH